MTKRVNTTYSEIAMEAARQKLRSERTNGGLKGERKKESNPLQRNPIVGEQIREWRKY